MTTSVKMDEDRSHMTERILNLTLEIIYLLTGENFPLLKSGDHVTITVPPCDSLKPERHNMEKILEVTKKMMELLTGEVPIRCQDVSAYSSMKEWEYLEGHRDLYKEVMMEDQPPLTSPDGSSKRNPPERCPRPLYSRDSTQEDLTIPHHDQRGNRTDSKVVVKEEIKVEHEGGVMEESSSYRHLPERCPRPLYSRESTQEDLTIPHHDQNVVEIKEEDDEDGVMEESEFPKGHKAVYQDNMEESSSYRNPPERCPRPLYSRDSTQEDHTIPHHDQGEDLMKMKVEGDIEETYVRDDQQCTEEDGMMRTLKEEDSPTEISTGHAMEEPSKDRLTLSPGCKMEDEDITADCAGEKTMSSAMDGRLHSVDRAWNPSDSEHPRPVRDGAGIQEEKTFSCSECGESFSSESDLCVHLSSHMGDKSFYCYECGKSFLCKADLVTHYRSHTGEKQYSRPDYRSSFAQKCDLIQHQRLHTRDKPYFCPMCGRSFAQKSHLTQHQRMHTGEKPYSCTECGRSFSKKCHVTQHQRMHTGEKPYSCSECGKCFTASSQFNRHKRVHTGEKPYCCSECGKSFTASFHFNRHKRVHTGEKPYCCSDCGKYFTASSSLKTHQRVHTGEKPFSCPECGKSFSRKRYISSHHCLHTGEKL